MKKNDMLNESTIRRFMKLATIDGLSDKFVAENLDETTDEVEEGRMRAKRDDDEMREGEHDDEVDEGRMRAKRDDDEMREGADEDEVDEGRMRAKRDDDEMREGAHEDDEDVKEGKHKDDDEMRESEEEVSFEEKMDMGADEPAAGGMVSVDQLMSALEKALEDVLGQEVEVSQDDDDMEMDMDLDMDLDAPDADEDKEDDEPKGLDEEDLEETAIQPDVVEEVFARVIQRLTKETKSNKE